LEGTTDIVSLPTPHFNHIKWDTTSVVSPDWCSISFWTLSENILDWYFTLVSYQLI